MRIFALLILVALLVPPWTVSGQGLYRWVDEKGTISFTDDPTLIPERYRSKVQPRNVPEESPVPSSPPDSPAAPAAPARRPAAKTAGPGKPQEQAAEARKKDILGRGEDWWRGKVKEWSGKLAAAKKGLEDAQTALKEKNKELEDAKFKPDSLKRKLRAEKTSLEEKGKDWEKQVEEAKNMLDKSLPKEAQDYGADPGWVKYKE